jgi:Domain of unknown function (DUF4224)
LAQALTLTGAELVNLTHKQRPTAQVRSLRFMGIEHRLRPDGSVAVDRSHYESVMGGKSTMKPQRPVKPFGINWED